MIVSAFVAPRPKDPSRSDCGTAFITSSESDEMKGMIMIPMTTPAASADSDAMSRPAHSPKRLSCGATVIAAK